MYIVPNTATPTGLGDFGDGFSNPLVLAGGIAAIILAYKLFFQKEKPSVYTYRPNSSKRYLVYVYKDPRGVKGRKLYNIVEHDTRAEADATAREYHKSPNFFPEVKTFGA